MKNGPKAEAAPSVECLVAALTARVAGLEQQLAASAQALEHTERRIVAAIDRMCESFATGGPDERPKRSSAPLKESVLAWEAAGLARGLDPRYLRQGRIRLLEAAEALSWNTLGEVTTRGIEEWLAGRAKNGATFNRLRGYWCAFLRWAKQTGRTHENGAEAVAKARELGGGNVTRAFSPSEAAAIIEWARRDGRDPTSRHKARDRWVLYLTAWFTGLRRSELRRVRVESLDLVSTPPRIRLDAKVAKARRAESVPLHPELIAPLRKLADGKPADARLFPHVRDELVARDIESAGVARMIDGRTTGLHSFRKGMATELARAGVAEGVAQALLRHSDPRLTRNVYTDSRLLPLADAIAGMERLLTSEPPAKPGCETAG